jgi:hypothetical protein
MGVTYGAACLHRRGEASGNLANRLPRPRKCPATLSAQPDTPLVFGQIPTLPDITLCQCGMHPRSRLALWEVPDAI